MNTKYLVGFAIIPALCGCAQLKAFNTKAASAVQAWWNNPSTQKGLQIGLQAATSALVSGAETAGLSYISDGTVHWTAVGKAAAATAARSIELTSTASDTTKAAVTVANAVAQATGDAKAAETVKTAVISGLTSAAATGADASGALEGVARAIEGSTAATSSTTTALSTSGK